jgi:uncharacterized membrane protein
MSNGTPETMEQAIDPADIEKNKVMGVLAYIIFFIPLLAAPDSKFGKYHANQGLLLLIYWVVMTIVSTIIPFIGWLIIGPLGSLFGLVLFIMGIINAAQGKVKGLPLIGGITIIKS